MQREWLPSVILVTLIPPLYVQRQNKMTQINCWSFWWNKIIEFNGVPEEKNGWYVQRNSRRKQLKFFYKWNVSFNKYSTKKDIKRERRKGFFYLQKNLTLFSFFHQRINHGFEDHIEFLSDLLIMCLSRVFRRWGYRNVMYTKSASM
jgi:hypothetical protein